ncbi:MAG: hypothetical protein H7318_14850 [Oligoflexus sp.]|nr:hypothetical protein [Oligoflexus sp.]
MLKAEMKPDWFEYPNEHLRVIDLKMTNLDPWFFLEGDQLEERKKSMADRYPRAEIIPFARRGDNDDVACWEKSGGNLKVYVVHDFSSNGWDKRQEFEDYWSWYRGAIQDMIEKERPYR